MSASETTVTTLLRAHAPHAPERLRAARARARAAADVAAAPARARRRACRGRRRGGRRARPRLRRLVVAEDAAHPPAVFSATGAAGTARAKGQPLQRAAVPSVGGAATRLQRTEASLELRVKNTSAATTKATRIATALGGYAESVTYSSSSHSASIVLRVPAQDVKTALARLGGLGSIVSQNLSVTDLQHDFQVESAQIAQLRRTIAALKTALRSPSLPDAQRVLLQIRLANAKRSLAQRLNARQGTVTAGTTARISLDAQGEERGRPGPAPARPARPDAPLGRRVPRPRGDDRPVRAHRREPARVRRRAPLEPPRGEAATRRAACDGIGAVLLAGLTTGHKIGLGVVALVFIAFALTSSFLAPRSAPTSPARTASASSSSPVSRSSPRWSARCSSSARRARRRAPRR